jgi:4-hydroxybenzoate polyprenyltransferase
MSWFGKIENFFVSFPLFRALIFAIPVYFSAMMYGVELSGVHFLLAFIVGFAIYSFNKGTDEIEDKINKPDQKINPLGQTIIPSAICSCLAIVLGLLFGGVWTVLALLIPLIIGLLYSKKFFSSLPRLKDVLGVKNFVVAFSMAFLGSCFASFMGEVELGVVVLAFLYVFIQIFINTIIFDVLDKQGDKKAKVNTLAVRFDKKKIIYFLLILNSLLFPWLGFCFTSGLVIKHLIVAAFGIVYTYGSILYFTTHEHKRFLAGMLVDGQWLLLVALMWFI